MKKAFIFFLIFLSFGCGNNQQGNSIAADDYMIASQLMDSHQTREAIAFIESQDLNSHPQKKELTLVLASAYAQQAGVNTQTILTSIKLLEENKDALDKLEDVEGLDSGVKSASASQSLTDFLVLSKQIHSYISNLKGIPEVSKERLPYLEKAIKILQNSDTMTPGQSLYKASLEIVMVRQLLSVYLIGNIVTAIANPTHCIIDVPALYNLSQKIKYLSEEIIWDLKRAMPSNKDILTRSQETLVQEFDNITNHLLLFMQNDNTEKIEYTPELSTLDIGKIFTCQ